MSKRNVSEAEVERVVRAFAYPSDENSIRHETRTWSSEDFVYAISRVHVDLQHLNKRDEILAIYKQLRAECTTAETQARVEAMNALRHTEITSKLEQLKKPHWTLVPNFWMTAISAAAAVVAAWFAWLALKK